MADTIARQRAERSYSKAMRRRGIQPQRCCGGLGRGKEVAWNEPSLHGKCGAAGRARDRSIILLVPVTAGKVSALLRLWRLYQLRKTTEDKHSLSSAMFASACRVTQGPTRDFPIEV